MPNTQNRRDFEGCGQDSGDGRVSNLLEIFQALLRTGNLFSMDHEQIPPGACFSLGFGPTFDFGSLPKGLTIYNVPAHPNFDAGPLISSLEEDNVSWRLGTNWKVKPDVLLYANISEGYKSGSYPTLANSNVPQMLPVTQESVLAYEVGVKGSFFDGAVDLNAAVFYYDYTDKQIMGVFIDPTVGPLGRLVNIPESHAQGFEVSAVLRPFDGLRINPIVSYTDTEIDEYAGLDARGVLGDRTGDRFPLIPTWQFTLGAQYDFPVSEDWIGFVGGSLAYQSATNSAFGDFPENDVPSRTLLDLRAGVEAESWVFSIWGRNVTDEHYWSSSLRFSDTVVRRGGTPATFGFSVAYTFQ
jgi:outer membrane receptor protein involved in Fe transport